MRSLFLNRQQLVLMQGALAVVVVVALLTSTAGLRAVSGAAGQVRGLRVQLDLSAAVTEGSLRTQAGDMPSPAVAFEALNRRTGGGLQVSWDPNLGVPRFLDAGSSAYIPYEPTAAEVGNPLAMARGFLDANRALFGLGSVAADFGPGRLEPDTQLGFAHVRLPQLYHGIPVFGKQLLVHFTPQGRIVAVNGGYVPELGVATEPTIGKEQAEQVALDDLKENQLDAAEAASVKARVVSDKTAPAVYVDNKGKATLTWSVKVVTTEPLGDWTFFVNARRPVVTHAIDAAEDAKLRETYTADNTEDIPGRLLIQEGERSRDPIAQAAQDNAGKVYDYYFNTFKRDGVDGRGSPMVSTVHYGSDPETAENAAWVGEAGQMVYGDGGKIFKPLAYGLDVVGHEFTHGVIESTSNLTYEGQAGALNESYADIFGALIDRANWTIGEAVVKSPPYPLPYLRSLQDPEAGGKYDPSDPLAGVGQPGSMSDYANLPNSRRADNGGVHINSGVPSHAAFFVAQALGKEKMEQIYFRAMTQYLSPDANFKDAGLATARAAMDLSGQQGDSAVRNAFRQIGIDLGGGAGPAPVPTGTAAPTPPPIAGVPTPLPGTPSPAQNQPAGCREAIVNGGFEGTTGWKEVTASNTELIDTELPHSGRSSAWLGGTDKEALAYIYQDVQIPANASSAKLSYYRLVHEEFTGLAGLFASDATFTVGLADNQGKQVQELESLASSQGDDKWKQAQFDLSRYAGRTMRVVFTSQNPHGNVSSFFVDDVSLQVCTTGQGPAAPSTSSSDLVYVHGLVDDADTGRGVEGAEVFFLRPGLSASSAADDNAVTDDEVAASGVTDRSGNYQTDSPLKRNQKYSVIVVASGYRPLLSDNGLNLPANATNPSRADATLRRGR
ncbi:MAG: M4 family metallopeptidase [Chloroflexia bacterium]